jgi:hypothetical protein
MRKTAIILTVLLAGLAFAQDGPQRGKIKKVDADNNKLTLTVEGKDVEVTVVEKTLLKGADNKDIEGRLKDSRFKAGAVVMFKTHPEKAGVLMGLRFAGDGQKPGQRDGGAIQRGRLDKVDAERKVLTLTVGGKKRELAVSPDAQVLGAAGKDLKERLGTLKEGTDVHFKLGTRDGKEVIVALKGDGAGPGRREPPVKVDLSKLKALPELGEGRYQGQQGGLYPGGKNERPAAHEAAGLALAKAVRPLDRDGKPADDGKIVLLSVGMSNTSQVSQGFAAALRGAKGVNPRFLFVNGAQGGMTAQAIQSGRSGSGQRYWGTVDERLGAAGVTAAQVQAVWIKQADAGPSEGFPGYARKLEGELGNIVRLLRGRFPNLKLLYLSGRTYGGHATTRLNPEPYAFESGFAVKWLIEKQIAGDADLAFDPRKGAKAPWLSWGPYLWDRSWTKDDYAADGTHLSSSGQRKAGALLLRFLEADATAKGWFLAPRAVGVNGAS